MHMTLQVDSILITIGDIAQVWSNGGLKKVRGRAVPSSDSDVSGSDTISMTLMLTLPLESTVSPLPRKTPGKGEETGAWSKDDRWVFDSFSFEDYAWRPYHDRLVSAKDPLDRYRRSCIN
ncbi:hypothetical protein MLD38_011101 [Melastoma candidum]|uniref:Uncharacterized protein n=1 Tax=Melastoma candidum TaxID=119954 RepID=A0ACB9R2I1_9MYRT|nr:hypothetical protein MLD38_011101 [Melastoma candidum]